MVCLQSAGTEHRYQRMRFIGHSEGFIKLPAMHAHTCTLLMCVAHGCHVLTDTVLSKASPISSPLKTRRQQGGSSGAGLRPDGASKAEEPSGERCFHPPSGFYPHHHWKRRPAKCQSFGRVVVTTQHCRSSSHVCYSQKNIYIFCLSDQLFVCLSG